MHDQKRVVKPWVFLASLAIVIAVAFLISRNTISVASKPIDISSAASAPEEPMLKQSDNPLVATNYGAAPELNNTTWLNVDKPLKLKDLRGKVVLLEFWTFGCYNCKNTLPAVKGWYDKFSDKGLVVIGDHFPEFAYESEVDNVKNFIAQEGIKYAVPLDNDGATWQAYNQRYWPTMYLIDKHGDIRYIAIGEHDYTRTESAIQALLSE
jgi:thiol-disulfide isomerase/thioredoxin